MAKTAKRLGGKSEGHVLGERTFAAITSVDGIKLSAASRSRLGSMEERKLSNDQKRSEVIRAYRSAKKQ